MCIYKSVLKRFVRENQSKRKNNFRCEVKTSDFCSLIIEIVVGAIFQVWNFVVVLDFRISTVAGDTLCICAYIRLYMYVYTRMHYRPGCDRGLTRAIIERECASGIWFGKSVLNIIWMVFRWRVLVYVRGRTRRENMVDKRHMERNFTYLVIEV